MARNYVSLAAFEEHFQDLSHSFSRYGPPQSADGMYRIVAMGASVVQSLNVKV